MNTKFDSFSILNFFIKMVESFVTKDSRNEKKVVEANAILNKKCGKTFV